MTSETSRMQSTRSTTGVRAKWVKPMVSDMVAGAAENGPDTNQPDVGVTFS